MLGQGISLLPLIRGENFPDLYAFMETGGIFEKPSSHDKSNTWGVRTKKWKYWKHAWRGEWLIDLENDPDEEENLIGRGLPIEDKLRQLVKKELIENTRTPEQIYAENAKARGISTFFTKQQIIPEISLFLLVQDKISHLVDVIDSILAQVGVYFELIIIDMTSDSRAKTIAEKYQDYRIKYKNYPERVPLDSILNEARGKYVSCIAPDIIYAPYFLYYLRNILQNKSEIALVYSNHGHIQQKGFVKVVNVKEIFNKKKNAGYCFLARKETIGNDSNSKIAIFDVNNLSFPLVKESAVFHTSKILGAIHKEGMNIPGLNILYKTIELIIRRRDGWELLKERMKSLALKLARIMGKEIPVKKRPYVTEVKKIILYLPTWGEYSSLDLYKDVIIELANSDEYVIILKPHIQTIKNERHRIDNFQKQIEDGKITCLEQDVELGALFTIANIIIADAMNDVFWESELVSKLPILSIHTESNFQKNKVEEEEYTIINNNPKSLIKDIKRIERGSSKFEKRRKNL